MHRERRGRGPIVGLAAVILAALVAQIALAGGGSGASGPKASASVVSAKKFKKLKQQVQALQQQVEQLSRQPGPQGPPGSPGSDAQFNGAAAGGSLAGTYPDPSLADNAVTSQKVENLSLLGQDLAAGAIGTGQLAAGAVTASKLGTLTLRTAQVTLDATGQAEGNGAYDTSGVEKDCNFGERSIAVGGTWGLPVTGTRLDEELVTVNMGFKMLTLLDGTVVPNGGHARVGNDTSSSRTFTLQVVCLAG